MYKVNDVVQVVCKCNEHCGEFGVIQVAEWPGLCWPHYGVQLENGKRDWFYAEELMLAVEPTHEEPVVVINSGEEFDLNYNEIIRYGSINNSNPTPNYYNYMYKGIKIDPYRISKIYNLSGPQEHAVKKLLRAGNKEGNNLINEIDEVIKSLVRWKEMIEEDSK